MKSKYLYMSFVALALFGFYLNHKAPQMMNLSSIKSEILKTSTKTTSQSSTPATSKQSAPSTEVARPEIKFDDQGAFGVANPALPREDVVGQFAKGHYVDGIVIKANYSQIYDNFKKGTVFEVPTVDGRSVYVVPRRVVVNPDGVSIFIAETEHTENTNESAALNETTFMFLKDRFIGGQLRISGKVFTMANGRDGTYLLEIAKNAKID